MVFWQFGQVILSSVLMSRELNRYGTGMGSGLELQHQWMRLLLSSPSEIKKITRMRVQRHNQLLKQLEARPVDSSLNLADRREITIKNSC